MKPATLEAIAAELLRLHGLTDQERAAEGFRRLRPAEPALARFPFSARLDALVSQLVAEICLDDPDIRAREASGDMQRSLRAAIAACGLQLSRTATTPTLARRLQRNLAASIERLRATGARRTIAVGCTLLAWDDFDALTIGPVRFRSRLDWLQAEAAVQGLSGTGLRRIEARWRGQRRGGRRASRDATLERSILDTVGDSRFVCSVATRDLGEQAALDSALDAARVTLAGLALMWERPGRALAAMALRYDRVAFERAYVAAANGRLAAGGTSWSQDRNGAWMPKADWPALLRRNAALLRQLAEVMDDALAGSGAARRPRLSAMLYGSLLWFEAGCREETDRFAVAKFGAALAALATRDAGVRDLAEARLGPGAAAEAAAVIAAPDDTEDWGALRIRAEAVTGLCLRAALRAASEGPARDDPAVLSRG